jgi:AraC-like DNA-binding protein
MIVKRQLLIGRCGVCPAFAALDRSSQEVRMDVLSDVLREIRLTGAVYFDIHAGAPWIATTPGSASICASVMPEFEHVIAFHIMIDGGAWAHIVDEPQSALYLDAGDAVIFPRGHSHTLSSEQNDRAEPDFDLYRRAPLDTLPFVFSQFGGQGDKARLVCAFLGCNLRPYNPVLDALPPMLHVKRSSAAGSLTFDLMRVALEESQQRRAGGETILAKVSELMFLNAVRQYIDSLPADSTGWLAALRDRYVSAALRAMHAKPAEPWTLDSLGREAGLSRTAFATRFSEVMGIPAIQYLSNWRLQVAAGLLDRQGMSIGQVAADVGFGSEAAFNRAFKRQVGMPPGAWRMRNRPHSPG